MKTITWHNLTATYQPHETAIMRDYLKAGLTEEAKRIHELKALLDAQILDESNHTTAHLAIPDSPLSRTCPSN